MDIWICAVERRESRFYGPLRPAMRVGRPPVTCGTGACLVIQGWGWLGIFIGKLLLGAHVNENNNWN